MKQYVCHLIRNPHEKESGVATQGRKEVEVGTLLPGNDKNSVIVNYLLSYFLC